MRKERILFAALAALALTGDAWSRERRIPQWGGERWSSGAEGWRGDPREFPPPPPTGPTRESDALGEYARYEADARLWDQRYQNAAPGSWEERDARRQLRRSVDAAKSLLSAPGSLAGFPYETLERFALDAERCYQQSFSNSGLEELCRYSSRAGFEAAYDAFIRELPRFSEHDLYDLQRSFDARFQNARSGGAAERYYRRCREAARRELARARPPAPPPAPYPPAPEPRRPRRDWQYDRVRDIARQADMASEASFGAANALHGRDASARAAITDLAALRDHARRLSNGLDQRRNDPYETQLDFYAVLDAYERVRRSTWFANWHPDVRDNLRKLEQVMGDLEHYYPQR